MKRWLCWPRLQKHRLGHGAVPDPHARPPPAAQASCPHPSIAAPSVQKPSLSPTALVQMRSGCLGKDTETRGAFFHLYLQGSWSLWITDQAHMGMAASVPPMVLTVCSQPVLKRCKNSSIFSLGSWEKCPNLTLEHRLAISHLAWLLKKVYT